MPAIVSNWREREKDCLYVYFAQSTHEAVKARRKRNLSSKEGRETWMERQVNAWMPVCVCNLIVYEHKCIYPTMLKHIVSFALSPRVVWKVTYNKWQMLQRAQIIKIHQGKGSMCDTKWRLWWFESIHSAHTHWAWEALFYVWSVLFRASNMFASHFPSSIAICASAVPPSQSQWSVILTLQTVTVISSEVLCPFSQYTHSLHSHTLERTYMRECCWLRAEAWKLKLSIYRHSARTHTHRAMRWEGSQYHGLL